jgi:hypothetical protein
MCTSPRWHTGLLRDIVIIFAIVAPSTAAPIISSVAAVPIAAAASRIVMLLMRSAVATVLLVGRGSRLVPWRRTLARVELGALGFGSLLLWCFLTIWPPTQWGVKVGRRN